MNIKRDVSEIAAQDAANTWKMATGAAPPVVQIEIINGKQQYETGYAIGRLEGSTVRCVVPPHIDVSDADGTSRYVVWAISLTGKMPSGEFIAIGLAWNGRTNTRQSSNTDVANAVGGVGGMYPIPT